MDQRRLELGLRWKQVTTRADITHQTLLQLRKGAEVSDLTVANVERALEWQPGSIERIRSGREPERAAAPDADPQPAPAPQWEGERVGPDDLLHEDERLLWKDEASGRFYRLADKDDASVHAEHLFYPGETPPEVIDDLRDLLAPYRVAKTQMERRRARR